MRFEKWQALGNDYAILEERELPFVLTPERVRILCAPHTGVGSDGVLLLREPGDGDLGACRASLWAALDAAGAQLAASQGPNPDAWRADATRERISFAPGLLTYTMRYTNRPTGIQQVIEFKGHR